MVMKEFTLEEIQKCTGADGNPAYVVHKGRVIDVSQSKLWASGLHMNRHHAGGDLSADIQAAPHAPDVLDRYPQVGVLKQQPQGAQRQMPQLLAMLLKTFPHAQAPSPSHDRSLPNSVRVFRGGL